MYITIESQALIHLIFSLEESQKPHRKPKVRLMTKYQEDEFTVRDGKITLYRRADSPSKVYQARFMANGKCIRRSTNESNRNSSLSRTSNGLPSILGQNGSGVVLAGKHSSAP